VEGEEGDGGQRGEEKRMRRGWWVGDKVDGGEWWERGNRERANEVVGGVVSVE